MRIELIGLMQKNQKYKMADIIDEIAKIWDTIG